MGVESNLEPAHGLLIARLHFLERQVLVTSRIFRLLCPLMSWIAVSGSPSAVSQVNIWCSEQVRVDPLGDGGRGGVSAGRSAARGARCTPGCGATRTDTRPDCQSGRP